MTGIDEALDDTFLFYFDIPVFLQSLTGVVRSSLFFLVQSLGGDIKVRVEILITFETSSKIYTPSHLKKHLKAIARDKQIY